MRIKKILKQPRVLILLAFLLISFLSINHQFSVEGVAINAVDKNSSAYATGLRTPAADVSPTDRERIIAINDREVKSLEDYSSILSSIQINQTVKIKTTEKEYTLIRRTEDLGITVSEPAKSNLRKGLELQGGTRVLLQPEEEITDSEVADIVDVMENRLNIYGLSDIVIKSASDLEGNKFIVVEIAGITKEEVKELIENQGRFEAKIGNVTVFQGGHRDVTFVCRTDATCSRIITPCSYSNGQYSCRFEFEISLSPEAAERHAETTENLAVISSGGTRALNETIDFYLDNVLVDQLQIDASLKGQKATRIVISGPGFGATQEEAVQDAIKNKNNLQTVLITGSLPTKLRIEKIDSLSPTLGNEFVKNALFVGLISVIAVGLVIYIRYRKLKVTIPIMITVLSEIYIILGFAALFKQNLDLAAIAAIIAAVGTGVDHQIVIIDEVLRGGTSSIKQSTKRAFFVIFVAFAATVAAMLPLLRAGAGLLTGFAIVTIVGVASGVFITRPAFAAIVNKLMEE